MEVRFFEGGYLARRGCRVTFSARGVKAIPKPPEEWQKWINQYLMENEHQSARPNERWAHFRFSVVGPLLAAPPKRGELQEQLRELAIKKWRHPISGEWTLFGHSTIQRWYYKALASKQGPVDVLKRKIRCDQGTHRVMSAKLAQLLKVQYSEHPQWSYQLHTDNLEVLVNDQPELGPMPSYASVLRFMKSHALFKRRRRGPAHSPGAQAAEKRFQALEIRSYESELVNGLWHLDFHPGSLRVLLSGGQWVYPLLLGILDDRSRLCCHLQWYLAEGAQELCHGLSQAFQKRQLPRSILFDNGSAMIARETKSGLTRLSILAEHTLPFCPFYVASIVMWPTSANAPNLPSLPLVSRHIIFLNWISLLAWSVAVSWAYVQHIISLPQCSFASRQRTVGEGAKRVSNKSRISNPGS